MKELLLVVTIAGERVALPAAAVESVVELDTLIPVPRAAPHVAGLSPEATQGTVELAGKNLTAFFSGQPVLTPIALPPPSTTTRLNH